MPVKPLTQQEKTILLSIARQALENAVRGIPLPELDLGTMSEALQEIGASFVTLTIKGDLRGCIGALEAYQPLAIDVQDHAVAAALEDYRFPQVRIEELNTINIEVSRLTPPVRVDYQSSDELLKLLRPGLDGVILRDGRQRATFLPQVWDKISGTASFLNQLCLKMGEMPDTWRKKHLDVFTYQVEEFHE
jgi:AmmeMemoRadiSam system protein A